jgi:hypothetical protein
MWQVAVLCSGCGEESEVVVEAVDDIEREVCPCGYSFAVLSVASFEPVYAEHGQVLELRSQSVISLAA